MNRVDINVSISPQEAANLVVTQVVNGSVSGELIDRHESRNAEGSEMIVLIFEKYYMRNSSRASLTVSLDNLSGMTQVRATGSGGGQGVFLKFDWGAGNNFSNQVIRALEAYSI